MRIFKEVVRSVHRRLEHRLGNLHWKKVIVVSIKNSLLYYLCRVHANRRREM